MSDLRMAAEMALEALEYIHTETSKDEDELIHSAIESLRQALAQPKQETLGSEWVPCVKLPVIVHVRNQREGENHISTREGITPVLPDDLIMRGVAGEEYPIGRDLFERTYTFDVDTVNTSQERETAKGEHEPVAWMYEWGGRTNFTTTDQRFVEAAHPHFAKSTPLYTAPPKREWVGLTDEEFMAIAQKYSLPTRVGLEYFKDELEAKLKEKNT